MGPITKMFVRARESVVRSTRGQTMTEYALILAAIAVVVYGTYRALGNNIGSLSKVSIPPLPTPENPAGKGRTAQTETRPPGGLMNVVASIRSGEGGDPSLLLGGRSAE